MSMESEVFGRLSGYAGLTALVGTRIYPVKLPQNPTLPACTIQRVSTDYTIAMGNTAAVRRSVVQVSVWAPKAGYTTMVSVAAQVRAALEQWTNPSGSPVIHRAFSDSGDEIDFWDDQAEVFHRPLSFVVIHDE